MWFPSWLRKPTVSPKQRPARRFRPRLEVLEDRSVPATLTVNTTLDVLGHANGMLSLRQAVLDANARTTADTIVVPAGTYNLTLAEPGDTGAGGDLDINASGTAALTISGAGAGTTIIDGGGRNRIFDINLFGAVSISGVTMQDGNAGPLARGGAVWSQYATLSVSNCTFSGNTAFGGGAIGAGRSLTVSNCTFSGNTTANLQGGSGGAIYAYGTLAVSNCMFAGNGAGFGGAIYSSGAATIDSSSFSGNSGTRGGAILNAGGTMTVSSCTVSGNSASQYGAGILNGGNGKLVIRDSTVSGNTAPAWPDLAGTASIFNSTIGNTYYP